MNSSSDVPRAVVPVIRNGQRVLVIKRAAGVLLPGYWCPPSGRIEPGESEEHALVREVKEELGIDATPIAKVWECPTDDGDFALHWWIVEAGTLDLRPDPAEVAEYRWVTPEEFLQLQPTFDGDREFFRTILPGLEGMP